MKRGADTGQDQAKEERDNTARKPTTEELRILKSTSQGERMAPSPITGIPLQA
jgi:hypothetical protein